MPFSEHLMFAPETTWGTYVAPTMAIPVRSANFHASRPLAFLAETGAGRGRRLGVLGEKGVKGGFDANFSPLFMPFWLRSVMGARTCAKVVLPPTFSTATGAITGGTLAAGAYKYMLTAVDPTGESGPSTELTGTVASGTTGSVVLVWTASASVGVTGVKVYRTLVGGATGTEKYLATIAVGTLTYTDTGSATPGATINLVDAYSNAMVPDDSVDYGSFSVQQLNAAGLGTSYKGVKMDGAALSLRAKEPVTLKVSTIAQDEALITGGSTWADGTSAPTTAVSPVPYPAASVEPFKFYQASLMVGGTPTLASNAFTVAGGSAFNGIEAIDIDMKFGLDAEGFTVNGGNPTIQYLVEVLRSITIKVTADLGVVGSTYYTQWMQGLSTALVVDMRSNYGTVGGNSLTTVGASGRPFSAKLTFPYLRYQEAPLPDISGSIARRKSTLTFEAYVDPTSGKDFGMTMVTSDNLT